MESHRPSGRLPLKGSIDVAWLQGVVMPHPMEESIPLSLEKVVHIYRQTDGQRAESPPL